MKVYVGNIPFSATEESLREFFESCGTITDLRLIKDRETGRSKGFAFVTFSSTDEMNNAIARNGEEVEGRALRINQAEDKRR